MRRMFTLLHKSSDPNCFLRLYAEFRSDLAWWLAFASSWNGVSFLQCFTLMHQDLGDVVLFGAPVGFKAIGLVSGLTCQLWSRSLCLLFVRLQFGALPGRGCMYFAIVTICQ